MRSGENLQMAMQADHIERPTASPAPANALTALEACLREAGQVVVAVSGGVDSMTLAHVAHRTLGSGAAMVHAVSPAVPQAATARICRHARAQGWALAVFDAGEFGDEAYRENPVDRCFYCKKNLYSSIAARLPGATIASGTNIDDLGDFRPGLDAAKAENVLHPFVVAGLDKPAVRALARHLELDDLADLPAAPCLSSRVETGIRIEADALVMIDEIEAMIIEEADPATARCRLRRDGIVLEIDAPSLAALDEKKTERLADHARAIARQHGHEDPVSLAPYRMGSAFLRDAL